MIFFYCEWFKTNEYPIYRCFEFQRMAIIGRHTWNFFINKFNCSTNHFTYICCDCCPHRIMSTSSVTIQIVHGVQNFWLAYDCRSIGINIGLYGRQHWCQADGCVSTGGDAGCWCWCLCVFHWLRDAQYSCASITHSITHNCVVKCSALHFSLFFNFEILILTLNASFRNSFCASRCKKRKSFFGW